MLGMEKFTLIIIDELETFKLNFSTCTNPLSVKELDKNMGKGQNKNEISGVILRAINRCNSVVAQNDQHRLIA